MVQDMVNRFIDIINSINVVLVKVLIYLFDSRSFESNLLSTVFAESNLLCNIFLACIS